MGVSTASGATVSAGLIAPAMDLVLKVLDDERPYRFGGDDPFLRRVIENNLSRFGEAKDIRFPHHIIFINRTAVGHYGNLSRLRVAAPWRRLLETQLAWEPCCCVLCAWHRQYTGRRCALLRAQQENGSRTAFVPLGKDRALLGAPIRANPGTGIGWCGAAGEYNSDQAFEEHPMQFSRITVNSQRTGAFPAPARRPGRASTRADDGAGHSSAARTKSRMPALRCTHAAVVRYAQLSGRHRSAAFPPR